MPDRPFILGHELSAEVAAVGEGVDTVKAGQRVTVNPARSCGFCAYCKGGQINLCRKIIMLGSASTTPQPTEHLPNSSSSAQTNVTCCLTDMDDAIGAMMEPLSVALHAVSAPVQSRASVCW